MAFLLHEARARVRRNTDRRRDGKACADHVDIDAVILRQTSRKRRIVPEVCIAAADTGCAGLDWIGHALIPAQIAAGVVGLGSSAPEMIEAPARLCARIVEAVGKHARIEEGTAVAGVVDAVAVELARPPLPVERGQRAEERNVHDDARHDLGDRRVRRCRAWNQ